eukprot:scaffold2136_cov242-Pinguiococcus_pyrenoidosus.AAC.9
MNADSPAEGAGVPDPEDAERSAGVKPNAEEIEAEEMEEAEEDAFHSDESDEELTLSVNKANVNRAYVRASAKPLGEAVAVGDAGASGDLFKTVVATEGMAVAMGTVDAGLQDSGVADASAQGKVDRTGKAMVLEDESYNPELLRLLRVRSSSKEKGGRAGAGAERASIEGEVQDPRRRTAFDMDISSIETKPWEQPGADPADHFNFELSEQAWEAYAEKQLIILESREREKVGDAPLPIDRQDILELKRREAAMAQGFSVDSPGMFDGGGPPHPGAFGPGGPPRPPLGFRGGPPRGMLILLSTCPVVRCCAVVRPKKLNGPTCVCGLSCVCLQRRLTMRPVAGAWIV